MQFINKPETYVIPFIGNDFYPRLRLVIATVVIQQKQTPLNTKLNTVNI